MKQILPCLHKKRHLADHAMHNFTATPTRTLTTREYLYRRFREAATDDRIWFVNTDNIWPDFSS